LEFDITYATEEVVLPIKELIGRMTPWNDFGDDVFRCRYVFDHAPDNAMICLMQFYGYRVFLGVAMSPEFHEMRPSRVGM
jgi:hypothetical protein